MIAGVKPLDVLLRPIWVENVGYRYDVILARETIVSQARDPEYDAARVLHARGIRGRFRTIDFNTGKPRMIFDIEKAAKVSVIEREDTGLAVVPYRPMSTDDRIRLSAQRSPQGRVFPAGTVSDTSGAKKRAGGETVRLETPMLEEVSDEEDT